jgi:hypothetical protein
MRAVYQCAFLLILISCASRKVFTSPFQQNPTSYLFNVKADSARFLFVRNYWKYHGSLKFDLREMDYYGDDKQCLWQEDAQKALLGEENKNDIWMRLYTDSSTVYRNKYGKPLPYWMKCKARFEQVDDQQTRMEIIVSSAYVEAGESLLPSPPHFVNNPVFKEVKPTTVEEYKILLCFGKALGVAEQMPPLKTR